METIEHNQLRAQFSPEKGMNLLSYRKGEVEVIDQSTSDLLEQRNAGLGPIIGPHFHHRPEAMIRPIPNPEDFPHLAYVSGKEPFSHGVGRYAVWEVVEKSENAIFARCKGDDLLHGVALKDLEGQDFTLEYRAKLSEKGLRIQLSCVSESDSVVGLHTYYAIEGGVLRARVKDHYNDQGEVKPIPSTWNYGKDHQLVCDLSLPMDFGFSPFPDPLHGRIELETKSHTLCIDYFADNEENSWQMWHPEGASFVCIEPLSALDPRRPRLSVSAIDVLISIT